jgi:hypothetical protein
MSNEEDGDAVERVRFMCDFTLSIAQRTNLNWGIHKQRVHLGCLIQSELFT